MPRTMLRRIRVERWITYVLWAATVALLTWGTVAWVGYLSDRAEQAERQTEQMAELMESSARRQRQLDTLIVEFRDSVEAGEASRREFERVADAILQALDAEVERLSNEGTSARRLQDVRAVLATVAGTPERPTQVAGQAGGAPRPREPPATPKPATPKQPSPEQPRPAPRPEQRAQPEPPPQSNRPPKAQPPPQRQPKAQAQTQPGRPGNADPSGKAKGHDKRPGKAKGRR